MLPILCDNFELNDLLAFGASAVLKPAKAKKIIKSVHVVVDRRMEFADQCGVDKTMAKQISRTHRMGLVD